MRYLSMYGVPPIRYALVATKAKFVNGAAASKTKKYSAAATAAVLSSNVLFRSSVPRADTSRTLLLKSVVRFVVSTALKQIANESGMYDLKETPKMYGPAGNASEKRITGTSFHELAYVELPAQYLSPPSIRPAAPDAEPEDSAV